VLHDIRFSLRTLRREPLPAIAAISILALAISATAAVFGVADKVLLRPLPIEEPERVAVIWPRERLKPTTIGEISYATFRKWAEAAPEFVRLAAMGSVNWSLILREGEPATIPVAAVSGSFFTLLGATPAAGRTLGPEDDQRGSSRVAVVSHSSWIRRFGGDPDLVGRSLRFEDGLYTIIGIMPEGFDYPRGAELWVALVPQLQDASKQYNIDVLSEPGFGVLFVLGRLAPGVTHEAAQASVSALISRDAGASFRPDMEGVLTPLDEHIYGSSRPALIAVAGCVTLVLLIGCANVALLLLARVSTRASEFATRMAIGATRWHIVRQPVTDAWLLTTIAGAVAVGLTYWLVDLLLALVPADVPRIDSVRVDGRAIAFIAVVSVAIAWIVGSAAGVHAWHWNFSTALNGGFRVAASQRVRSIFLVGQVALAFVLLVGAGLVGRSFVNLLNLDLGFRPTGVVTLDVTLPGAPGERHNAFYAALLDRVRTMPGVQAAGAIYQRPLEHAGVGMDATILLEGQRTDLQFRDWEQNPIVNLEPVTPGYFETLGFTLVAGRTFAESDTERAPRVAIVSERLARQLWPGELAVGKRILPPGIPPDEQGRPRWATVVGVVGDARYRGLTDMRFDLYVPHLQMPGMLVKHMMVRAAGDPLSVVGDIRSEAERLDSAALMEKVARMDDLVSRATAPWRFGAWTLSVLGVVGLGLASFGIFAAVSQSVVERTREIGIRMAVGAVPQDILRLILRGGLRVIVLGIALGLLIALGVSQVLTALLYGVSRNHPATLALMAMTLLSVSLMALLVPAWQAARVDPNVALRQL
jgi:putative ABC transport system permease protein